MRDTYLVAILEGYGLISGMDAQIARVMDQISFELVQMQTLLCDKGQIMVKSW